MTAPDDDEHAGQRRNEQREEAEPEQRVRPALKERAANQIGAAVNRAGEEPAHVTDFGRSGGLQQGRAYPGQRFAPIR